MSAKFVMNAKKKSVGIISKPGKAELEQVSPVLVKWLQARGLDVVVDSETAGYAAGNRTVQRAQMGAQPLEFVIVLGGDGTLLAAARAVAKAGIPILPVNLGSLGFLTEVLLQDMYAALESIIQNGAATDERSMLHCQLQRNGECVAEYEALNDVVTAKTAIARTADFDLYVNEAFVSNYKADGVIIATPTGSTAYSLAAGGPVLNPEVHAFVVTPVCSHALTNRPLVLPEQAEIEIAVRGGEETYLTVDGQVGMPLREGDRIHCKKSKHCVRLFRYGGKTFSDVLRQKLKWGER